MSTLPSCFAVRLFAGALLLAALARGQVTYTGSSSGSDTWGIANNWSSFSVPASGDTVQFGSSIGNAPTLGTNSYAVAQINFTSDTAVAIGGTGTLTVSTGITVTGDGFNFPTHTIAPPLALGGSSAVTFSIDSGLGLNLNGIVSGSHGLTKSGAGTLILDAANTYTGTTTINGGTLVANTTGPSFALNDAVVINSGGILRQAGSLSLGTSTAVTVNTGGQLNLGSGDTKISSVTLAGGTVIGTGTASRLVTNGITTSASTSSTWSTTLALGASVGAANTTITTGAGSALTISGAISDGALVKTGSGTLTLSSANTYAGGTTINGGKVVLHSQGSLGSGAVTLNGGTLGVTSGGFSTPDISGHNFTIGSSGATFEASADMAIGTAISGTGALTKTGSNTLTLNGTNTYGGATTVSAGTLTLGSSGALPASSALTVAGGATFRTTSNASVGSISGAGNITLPTSTTLTVGGAGTSTTFSGNLTSSSTGADLIKTGAGTLTLSGLVRHAGNTTVSAGTLVLSGSLGNFFGSTTSGNILINGGTLDLNNTTKSTTGGFTLTSGTLQNGTMSSTVHLVQSGTVSAVLAGSGTLTKNAGGTVTLSGANIYSGSTYVYGGTLALSGSGTLGSTTADLILNGGTLDLGGTSQTKGIVTFAGGTLSNGTLTGTSYAAQSGTASAALSGSGALTKTTTDTVVLSGANTYTGTTTISAGTLQVGAGGTSGSIASSSIVNNAALAFNRSDASAYSGAISGSGTLTKAGAGTLTLTGSNSYSGSTTISGGTLQLGNGGTSGSVASSSIVNNGALIFNRSNAVTHAGNISGTGSLTKLGTGTLTLTGAYPYNHNYSYTGATIVTAGTLALGVPGGFYSTGALTVNGGTLDVGTSSTTFANLNNPVAVSGMAYLVSGAITGTTGSLNAYGFSVESGTVSIPLTGNGNLTKSTSGTVTLSGDNTYSGGTTISAGTLALGASNRLPDTGTLTISGGTLALGAFSDFVPTLSLTSGSITGTGTLNVTNTATVQSGTISANFSPYALTKSGGGTVTLTGNATLTSTTTISGGTLQLGDGGTTGSLTSSGISLSGGNLAFSRSDDVTFTQSISGTSGSVVNAGSGNLTLSGSLTMASVAVNGAGTMTLAANLTPGGGATLAKSGSGTLITTKAINAPVSIGSGTVRVDNGGSISGNVSVSAGATLNFNRSDSDVTYSSAITGSGSLLKSGSNTLRLTGSSTNNGGLTITGGLVEFSTLANLGSGSVTLNGGGLKWATSATTDASSRLSALGAGGGTINTNGNNVTFASALSGSGALTKTGSGTLTLSVANTYTGGTTLSAGILAIAANANLGAAAGAITFGGGTLRATTGFTATRATSLATGGGTFDVITGQTLTWNGAITGAAGNHLTKLGDGILLLGGANTYSGDTNVHAGTLTLAHADAFSPNTKLHVAPGASFNANGHAPIVGELSGTGTFDLGSAGLTLSHTADQSFSGTLASSTGGGFTKSGTGTLTLGGTHTFTGPTTVNAGRIHLTGTASNSAFTIKSGATLSGTGTLGALTLQSGAILSPGASPGTLSSGVTTWAGGASYLWEINHATGGTAGSDPGWDLLSISGALNITANASSKFTVDLTSLTALNAAGPAANFDPAQSYSFNFVTASGGISGFDTNVFTLDTSGFQNAFTGAWSIAQSGNNLNLTYTASAIPEPSTYAALAGAAMLGLAAWRRRRRA